MKASFRAGALACVLAALPAGLLAAPPAPHPMPSVVFPSKPLHANIIVEVNKRGQVVRVVGGTLSKDRIIDTMWVGNALQMWIRHPDGTAQTGLFRVTYDYNPRDHKVQRHVALVKAGGSWANAPGAALQMISDARRETREAYERLQAMQKHREEQSAKHLPDINAAVKRSMAKPSPRP